MALKNRRLKSKSRSEVMPDSCRTPHLVEMQDSLFPINHYKNTLFSQNISFDSRGDVINPKLAQKSAQFLSHVLIVIER